MSNWFLRNARPSSACILVFFVAQTSGVTAEPPEKIWAQNDPVRDDSDTVHLEWQRLRSWTQADPGPLPFARTLPDGYKSAWVSVLSSPDRELRRNALLSIGQAHQGGYADFSDVGEAVRKTFNRDDLRTITRVDAARTLVILDARAAAPDLMNYLQESPELRRLAEQAFADWDYEPAQAMWMRRLENPGAQARSHLSMALRGLSQVGHVAAADDILKIVVSSEFDSGLRLTAASGLAELRKSGLEDTSQQLLSPGKESPVLSALLAVTLLRRHSGEATEQLLLSLLEHSAAPVTARAWERLNELNPDRIPKPVLEQTLRDRDARLRLLAVRNSSLRRDPAFEWLRTALDDHHPDIRCLARHTLRDHERQAARENDEARVREIRGELIRAFDSDFSWRGLEQACLLAGELDHKPAATVIAALLPYPRNEVASAAAWSLKELAVADVLPQMLAYAQQLDARLESHGGDTWRRVEIVQTHLFEAFAELNYQPAGPLMRKYVPKGSARYETRFSRMAAIRSLAYLSDGRPDAELVSQLTERMFDWNAIPPEVDEVFIACAMAFGIMKMNSRLADLRKLLAGMGPDTPPGRAAFWAINQLTGEPIPPKTQFTRTRGGWFLTVIAPEGE